MKKFIMMAMLSATAMGFCQTSFPKTPEELTTQITKLDTEAFDAYNKCDLSTFKTYFTDDLEFYHDKGGPVFTSSKLIESMESGMCGNPNWKLRREVVQGSLKVYSLHDNSRGYGAVLTGEHYFYITENGKESKTGVTKFTHLWLLKDGRWQMSRVLSYDHRDAK
ncbi:MAG: nuclear transport factor 2 family protein [Flavobacterium sp.]|nr:MAG: nuclear transport factor 2 family protein [Flavobacterium sp.]